MADKTIEAVLVSPPDCDDLAVDLFATDGDGWGRMFKENGVYVLKVPCGGGSFAQFPVEEVLQVLTLSLSELRSRDEAPDVGL